MLVSLNQISMWICLTIIIYDQIKSLFLGGSGFVVFYFLCSRIVQIIQKNIQSSSINL